MARVRMLAQPGARGVVNISDRAGVRAKLADRLAASSAQAATAAVFPSALVGGDDVRPRRVDAYSPNSNALFAITTGRFCPMLSSKPAAMNLAMRLLPP